MTPPKKNWRDFALCRNDDDAELWFPVGETGPALLQIEEARAVCRRCPVASSCFETVMALEGGADRTGRHGVWAATTPGERAAIHKQRVKQRAAERARQAVTAA